MRGPGQPNQHDMSNATTDKPGNGPKRRRSRGGRNRNRNNPNRNQGQSGNRQGGGNRSGRNPRGGQGQRQGNGGRRSPQRRPEPPKLTWWQKLLQVFGLYEPPTRSGRKGPKSNTRVAKGEAGERVKSDPPRAERADDGGRADRGQAPEVIEPESNRIYLGNLSYEATESDLEELFKGVGNVRRVEIVYNRRTHRSKGYGFIEMVGTDDAKRAVEVLHDQFFMGRKLVVSGAKSAGPADAEDDDTDSSEA